MVRNPGGKSQRPGRGDENQSIDQRYQHEIPMKRGHGERQRAHAKRKYSIDGRKPDERINKRQMSIRPRAEPRGKNDADDGTSDQYDANEQPGDHSGFKAGRFRARERCPSAK